MFEDLIWQKDRLMYNGLVFRLQHYKNDDWELGENCFVFYKIKHLIDQYAHFFASRSFRCQRLLELGMWEGGSLAFWFETLRPDKVIGIDISDRKDSPYFQRYVSDRDVRERVKTYWRVSQADKPTVREIVRKEFDGPLDLVIDDASHIYEPTLSSFQTLFPLIRPGGFYIIEDWAWEHWPDCYVEDRSRDNDEGLSDLVSQLVQAAGTSDTMIKSVTVYQGFAAVERSGASVPQDVQLKDYIVRRPKMERAPGRSQHSGTVARLKRSIRGLLGR
jgi:cephalosporin hydroxylase